MPNERRSMAPTKPWLTVVMPVHDGGDYLGATLESMIGEVDQHIEIILIDSSNTGRCADIVEMYQASLSIDYSHRSDLKSWQSKMNEGVVRARAPYVAMLHQDDLWLPGRIKSVRQNIRSCPKAVMYLSPSIFIDGQGRHIGNWRCPLGKRKIWQGRDVLDRLLVQNFIAIPAPVIRKSDWLAVGGMDEELWYTADWDLYLKLCPRGDIVYAPTLTTGFRVHATSLTIRGSSDLEAFRAQLETVAKRHINWPGGKPRQDISQIADASIRINVALAGIAAGKKGHVRHVFAALFSLLPLKIGKYLRYSRIIDRVIPRFRAQLYRA